MLIIDKYSYTNNLKDITPIIKAYLAMGLLILAISIEWLFIHIGIITVMSLIIVIIAKIPFKNYVKILLIPISFLILSISTVLLSISKGNIDCIWGIKVLTYNLAITASSFNASKVLFFRAFAALNCTFFLVLTTPMNQLICVMNKHKIPKIFIEICVLMYRFIFIFLEESK